MCANIDIRSYACCRGLLDMARDVGWNSWGHLRLEVNSIGLSTQPKHRNDKRHGDRETNYCCTYTKQPAVQNQYTVQQTVAYSQTSFQLDSSCPHVNTSHIESIDAGPEFVHGKNTAWTSCSLNYSLGSFVVASSWSIVVGLRRSMYTVQW